MQSILYLALAMLLFAVQDALFKQLTHDYVVIQLLTIRMTMVVCVLGSICLLRKEPIGFKTFRQSQWPLLIARGIAAFSAFFLYYFTLQRAELAESATVLMTAPLFVTALSVPLLGEKVGVHRWAAVCIGFTAVIVMLRPGTSLFNPIMVLPLISALLYSLIPIITRLFREEISTLAITFYTVCSYWVCCVITSVLVHVFPATENSGLVHQAVAASWNMLSVDAFALLFATAILFVVGIFLVTLAYRKAQASAITSFEYLYLVWAIIVGYVLFDNVPRVLTIVAAVLIVGAGIYISWREHQTKHVVKSETTLGHPSTRGY